MQSSFQVQEAKATHVDPEMTSDVENGVRSTD